MLCLKKRRTYSFTQGACTEVPRHKRRSASSSRYNDAVKVATAAISTKQTPREERSSAMVLTVTEDTPADMLTGSMELLVQIPRDEYMQSQRVTVQRNTPMMDLLVQIATAHKLTASSYTLQAIDDRGLVLPHQPNTPIGALNALQVNLLPKQGTFLSQKNRQPNQPFETTFRLQVHLPRNQLYVSRVSPKTNLGHILDEVCREKNLDRNKYELRHPVDISKTLDLNLTLQDYQIQEVNLYSRQPTRTLSSQDIMDFQRQEECRRQQQSRNHGIFGFMFKKSKENSLSNDSLGNRSVSPARSDETARSSSPVQQQEQQSKQPLAPPPPPPSRPLRKRRPAPKPPTHKEQHQTQTATKSLAKNTSENGATTTSDKDKIVISHSRNSSDSSGYHEASVLSDNPDNNGAGGRMPETLPRRYKMQDILESPRKLAHTSQTSKSLSNLAMASSQAGTLSRGISNTSLSSTGQRKKRSAPLPPVARPLPSAISVQGLERIVDSDESLTSDMELSKPSSDIDAAVTGSSHASSDIACHIRPTMAEKKPQSKNQQPAPVVESARVVKKEQAPPVPKLRSKIQQGNRVEPPPSSLLKPSSRSSSMANIEENSIAVATHGLPSLTEDEREEINLAIDSIYVAVTGHSQSYYEDDSSMSFISDCGDKKDVNSDEKCEEKVFYNAEYKEVVENKAEKNIEKVLSSVEIKDNTEETVTALEKEDPNPAVVEKINLLPVAVEEFVEKKPVNISDDQETLENHVEEIKSVEYETLDFPPPNSKIFAEQEFVENSDSLIVSNKEPIEIKPEKFKEIEFNVHDLDAVEATVTSNNNVIESKLPEPLEMLNIADEKDIETIETSIPNKHIEFDLNDNDTVKGSSCTIISMIPKSHAKQSQTEINDDLNYSSEETIVRSAEASTVLGSDKPAATTTTSVSATPTDTDILLQKVSDTLSQAVLVPLSPPPTPEEEENVRSASSMVGFANEQKQKQVEQTGISANTVVDEKSIVKKQQQHKSIARTTSQVEDEEEEEEEQRLVTSSSDGSAQNLTVASQQDTSDYVSASGEDLSVGDWEYQIPAPPSAFRDNSDVEPAPTSKESISIEVEVHHEKDSKQASPVEIQKLKEPVAKVKSSTDFVDFVQPKPVQSLAASQLSNDVTEQKKAEVISELEKKINSNSVNSKPVIVEATRDDSNAPKIAPVENNLANFTITTYSRPKSLDIFDSVELQQPSQLQRQMDHSETRVISNFATLTRGKSIGDYNEDNNKYPRFGMKSAISMERVSMPLVDDRAKFAKTEKHEVLRDKLLHRSKSYIILPSNEKFQNKTNEVEMSRDEKKVGERSHFESKDPPKKFTSLATMNSTSDDIPRKKEKFSQWRDNILKRQEEPTPEKQLQSLQVLKSILPQLKNAQATERNNYKNTTDSFSAKERQESLREQSQVISSSIVIPSEVKLRPVAQRRNNEPNKRYTYCGPPAVSLGSWSERPSLSVQIKSDTDYKLGNSALSGARTVVNLNSEPSEEKEQSIKTTAVKTMPVHFKPMPIPVNAKEPKKKKEESNIDTSSVNFKELTKAFGQEVRTQPKPPVTVRALQQRQSEYFERNNIFPRVNGFSDSHANTTNFGINNNTNGPPPPVRRYTSVVGFTNNDDDTPSQQTSFRYMNGQTKTTQVPVVKAYNGFEKTNNSTVPKPPTMPIITGVTLKSVSARPKSSPSMIQQDPRDQLLESIRNFGGREKLRKSTERR